MCTVRPLAILLTLFTLARADDVPSGSPPVDPAPPVARDPRGDDVLSDPAASKTACDHAVCGEGAAGVSRKVMR